MPFLHILILSVVEGLTEFLPISSTGHLILTSAFLNIESTEYLKAFEIIIQFGAILAVVVLYRERLRWNFEYYKKVFYAFLPAAGIGFLFKDYLSALMDSTVVVAWALIVGGIILLFIDSVFKGEAEELTPAKAWLVGVLQCTAFIPGVSRSAATIIGSQIAGLTREKAAEFSFILAIPTLTAATGYKLWKIRNILDISQSFNLALGIILSFVFAILAIQFFISILNKYGLKYFGVYRILLGGIVLYVHWKGLNP
ncbi:MAG: UDP-diphosphatase [Bdellovibrionales bacterium RIFCSPHIGHO2_01_FULL_40_29]|nr:MAG: UDP-diphosphatase [Bdellovibrionales bacterium RIFCSPHIGHO2_01_FULL_40_29]OFZ33802.1 MAG: UDP-diphosphatase [Bdellovibrionales bacterium RIFCSPHIGHO2_02_FULL_40_15]